MAASIVPALIDVLVTQATSALPGVNVLDGIGVTDDPGDYLMVGTDDPDSIEESEAATVAQEQFAFGASRPRKESGYIHMAARSIDGSGNQKAARDAVYAIQEALATVLRVPENLNVTGLLTLGNGSSLSLREGQDSSGARATLLYDIAFEAQI